MQSRPVVALLAVIAVAQLVLVALLATRPVPPLAGAPAATARPEREAEIEVLSERIKRVATSLERVADRLDRAAVAGDGEAAEPVRAPGRPRVTPQPRDVPTPGAATQTPVADVRFEDISDRQLLLEADERVARGNDLAGAVARYETVLSRAKDTDVRIDTLTRLGTSYATLGRRERARTTLGEAIATAGPSDPRSIAATRMRATKVSGWDDNAGAQAHLAALDALLAHPSAGAWDLDAAHSRRRTVAHALGRTEVELESLRWLAANAMDTNTRPWWTEELRKAESR